MKAVKIVDCFERKILRRKTPEAKLGKPCPTHALVTDTEEDPGRKPRGEKASGKAIHTMA
jgi:hypothetical protein